MKSTRTCGGIGPKKKKTDVRSCIQSTAMINVVAGHKSQIIIIGSKQANMLLLTIAVSSC